MANFKILLVLSILFYLEVTEGVNGIGPEPPHVTLHQPISPTENSSSISNKTTSTTTTTTTPSKPDTTTSSTLKPNTTTSSTTTTTTPKSTTTTVTTPKTTTTTTSTPKPTTTPTAKTTTPITPTPKPVPEPSIGKWSLNYTNSTDSCLLMDAALQIEIPNGNLTSLKINIPFNATAMGNCGKDLDVLILVWEENIINMNFVQNATDKKFALGSIAGSVNVTLSNGTSQILNVTHKKSEFSTMLDHSYKCAKVQTLNLTAVGSNDTIALLHISHVQFQAFSNVTQHKFYDAIDCEASAITSDVVPIVVGCVLALLVVVVLVAYLVGRRYCQARGYHSIPEEADIH
ncbi:lysosome-associated membrane glycoprotein 1-like isoform X2 [Diabrotica undecimpunctata]|uniref:lysosome-associated membrane glycoprotein 1-like isoform X2 n=1 Tax=Diabrotica undecimpunctata TaxID=50387 RepID=UPI003B637A68